MVFFCYNRLCRGKVDFAMTRRCSILNTYLLLAPVMSAWMLLSPTNGRLAEATASSSEESVAALRGRSVYDRACAACHGTAGDGNGPAARYLDPRPRDFTFGMYKFRSTPYGMPPTDEDLYRTVTFGIPTTTMPPYKDILSEQERRDVVAYIKSFSENFASIPAVEPIRIPEVPDATPQSIAEGKSAYMINACWTCHGAQGKGHGEAASSLKDVWGNEVRPVDFTLGSYKGGSDARSIFRTVNTGITGTPMPPYDQSFLYGSDGVKLPSTLSQAYTEGEIAELQAYLTSQPTKEQIRAMSDAALEELTDRRKWALVHYLKSLSKEPGLWHRLFVEDTEVTQ